MSDDRWHAAGIPGCISEAGGIDPPVDVDACDCREANEALAEQDAGDIPCPP